MLKIVEIHVISVNFYRFILLFGKIGKNTQNKNVLRRYFYRFQKGKQFLIMSCYIHILRH